ncbi:SufE family protein [Maritalea myrionectae]|uniref:Putative SufE-like protein n=1 Tax=Maritalea myrionectae TaxID=454601 RepID=A0A2R4MGJ5_9HYPH|nr:SufE family protein [Maritalea myrionectae]AVX05158.1 putative SufE-like protein [Maritalea myrionectae]
MTFDDIKENLEFLDDWEDRYKYVIELGQSLPPLPEEAYSPANKVEGCVSQVWLTSDFEEVDGKRVLILKGDSDAMIVKGLVAIVIAYFSGHSKDQIAELDAERDFAAIGLQEHLTTQRANGLRAMIQRVEAVAAAG